jgi:hypothetical protein
MCMLRLLTVATKIFLVLQQPFGSFHWQQPLYIPQAWFVRVLDIRLRSRFTREQANRQTA